MKKYFFVIGVLVVFGMSGCGQVKIPQSAEVLNEPVVTSTPTQQNIQSEFQNYTNDTYHFSLLYPKSWEIIETKNYEFATDFRFEMNYYFSQSDISNLRPGSLIPGFDIAVTSESFEAVVKKVEDMGRVQDGSTYTKVVNIQETTLNSLKAITGEHGSDIGLGQKFYFVQIPNQKKSLWISYTYTTEEAEKVLLNIISSLKLN
jgi:hypothetical protein